LGSNCGQIVAPDACGTVREVHCGPGSGVNDCGDSELITVVPDACIDDSGTSAINDNLEIYCQEGVMRFCLSGEACPWRSGPVPRTKSTCSAAGLSRPAMATLRGSASCAFPWGARTICCYSKDDRSKLGTALMSAGDCP
jgi:hypothetical protein